MVNVMVPSEVLSVFPLPLQALSSLYDLLLSLQTQHLCHSQDEP